MRFRDRPPRANYTQNIWQGTVTRGAIDASDFVYIRIEEFSASLEFGPCRWQARDATSRPNEGDLVLVVKDQRDDWWVIAWWPF